MAGPTIHDGHRFTAIITPWVRFFGVLLSLGHLVLLFFVFSFCGYMTEQILSTESDTDKVLYFVYFRISFFFFLPAQQFLGRAIDILGVHSPALHYEHCANFVTHANYYFTLRSLFDSLSWELLLLSMAAHGAGEMYMFAFRATPCYFKCYHRWWQSGPWRTIYRYAEENEQHAQRLYVRWLAVEYGSRFYLSISTVVVFAVVSFFLSFSYNEHGFMNEPEPFGLSILKLGLVFLWEMVLHVIIQGLNWRWYGSNVLLPWIEFIKVRVHLWWIGLTIMGYTATLAEFRVIRPWSNATVA